MKHIKQDRTEMALSPRNLKVAAAMLAFGIAGQAHAAGPESFRGDYTVSFLGFSVARATFSSTYDGSSYSIDGSVSSAGLATLFDDTRGTVKASGRFAGGQPRPKVFRADYTSGRKSSLVDIRFADGDVTATRVRPSPGKRGNDWVPLGAADLRAVADPIAASVIRASGLDNVCGRTVKMYDGEMRANLSLVPVSRGTISVKGYQGDTVTCRMQFDPVSGYRKGRKALDFLKNRSRIMVTFAPLGQTGVYAPVYATVGTEIGTITIRARTFEQTN